MKISFNLESAKIKAFGRIKGAGRAEKEAASLAFNQFPRYQRRRPIPSLAAAAKMHISKTSFCSFLRNLKVEFLPMKSIIILVTLSTPSVFIIPWLIDKAATAAAVVFFFL